MAGWLQRLNYWMYRHCVYCCKRALCFVAVGGESRQHRYEKIEHGLQGGVATKRFFLTKNEPKGEGSIIIETE